MVSWKVGLSLINLWFCSYASDKFRLKKAFAKNVSESDEQKIRELIDRGNYVVKELEALYSLRKYRAMKARYYDTWFAQQYQKVPAEKL